jgi:SAM-dependent methyltransferase
MECVIMRYEIPLPSVTSSGADRPAGEASPDGKPGNGTGNREETTMREQSPANSAGGYGDAHVDRVMRTDLGATGDAMDSDAVPTDVTEDRRTRWDARHATHEPIELTEVDPSLDEEVAGLTPGRALDLGAGDGGNAVWLALRGWRVIGVDFSSVGLERARARARVEGVTVDWELADLLEWRPPARAFDLVVLFFIHLPLDERRAVYRGAAEAVAPGGTLLIVGHDRSNLVAGTGGPQDPAVLFTAAEVAAEIPGLTIGRAEAVRRPVGGDQWRIDAVVRAVRSVS